MLHKMKLACATECNYSKLVAVLNRSLRHYSCMFVPLIGRNTKMDSLFSQTVQKRGAAIIAARKLSSAMSAAKAICDHMRNWWFGTAEVTFISGVIGSPLIMRLTFNNSSPKWRWLVMDIDWAAKGGGNFQLLTTNTEVKCFISMCRNSDRDHIAQKYNFNSVILATIIIFLGTNPGMSFSGVSNIG